MSRPLAGDVGIVTGAGRSLGRAFALHLASQGAAVVVNNRLREADADGCGSADRVVAEILAAGGRAVADHTDARDPSVGEALVSTALEAFGKLDFCVANAAVADPAVVHKLDFAAVTALLETNVLAVIRLASAVHARLRAAAGGRIVLISSTAGLHGEPAASAYAASKGAVCAFGRTLAAEGAAKGVLANVVLPYASTSMTAAMDPQFRAGMTVEMVAPVVAALVDTRSTLTGTVTVVGGGAIRSTGALEFATVPLPGGPLDPAGLTALLAQSRRSPGREYATAQQAFIDFAREAAGITGQREPVSGR